MATQATTRHNEAKAKQHAQACMLLERAYKKAMSDDLDEKDQARYLQIYLSRTMPELRSIEHSGETAVRVTKVEREIVDHAKD